MGSYWLYKQFAAKAIVNAWPAIIAFWLVAVVALRWLGPSWESVARDGDLQFLPKYLPSRVGQKLLDDAFPSQMSKSQIVLIIAKPDAPLENKDLLVTFDIARQLSKLAASSLAFVVDHQTKDPITNNSDSISNDTNQEHVKALLDSTIQLDATWFELAKVVMPERTDIVGQRLTSAYLQRATLLTKLGDEEAAEKDRNTLRILTSPTNNLPDEVKQSKIDAAKITAERKSSIPLTETELDFASNPQIWSAVKDVWTWEDPLIGHKLGANHANARMIVLQLSNEFMAVGNRDLMTAIDDWIIAIRTKYKGVIDEKLKIEASGPAAVGADMIRAAAIGVRQTEWISILAVLVILAIIYRSPILVAVPLLTVSVALSVSMSLIAIFAVPVEIAANPNRIDRWYHFLQVYTTTKIFLVVLLFGVGTDFCLFFVARCREEWTSKSAKNRKGVTRTIAGSWTHTHDAIVGSALTTSIGLFLMVFCQFEKFRNNGIIIAIAIMVTLLVSLTLTPSLMCALAPIAFQKKRQSSESDLSSEKSFWSKSSKSITSRPVTFFCVSLCILIVPAVHGFFSGHEVTYDFLNELSSSAPSRRGAKLIDTYFSTRDNSPITIVVVAASPFESVEEMNKAIDSLTHDLYLPGVSAVRSITDPLGDYPPDRRMGLFSQDAWRRRMLKNHRLTRTVYSSNENQYALSAARLDVLLEPNPFSNEAKEVLHRVDEKLLEHQSNVDDAWSRLKFAYSGTTAGIVDLESITQSDLRRIQVLVTIGVWCVLVLILRRPWFSGYLMATVVLSYLATLGLTHYFFSWIYAGDFTGLDWKVPLFLFVILVAVGQDYNVYLATRVAEEQSKHGKKLGLYRAMVSTGGIITSCGVVMAATFLSMTGSGIMAWLGQFSMFESIIGESSSRWLLRGILELGFALGVGVLMDTFIIRTIMVPAMLAWLDRAQTKVAD